MPGYNFDIAQGVSYTLDLLKPKELNDAATQFGLYLAHFPAGGQSNHTSPLQLDRVHRLGRFVVGLADRGRGVGVHDQRVLGRGVGGLDHAKRVAAELAGQR